MRNFISQIIGTGTEARFVSTHAAGILVLKIGGAGLALILQLFLTRTLGAEEYGVYIYLFSWIGVIMLFTKLGFDMAFQRFAPIYKAEGQESLFKGLCLFGGGIVLLCVFLTCLIGTGIIQNFDLRYHGLSLLLWEGAALLALLTFNQLAYGLCQSLKKALVFQVLERLFRPTALVGGLALLFMIMPENTPDARDVLQVQSGALAMSLILLAPFLVPFMRWKGIRADFEPAKQWTIFALPMFFMAGLSIMMNRIDIIMLGTLSGPTGAGIYAVASRIGELGLFGLTAVEAVFIPYIAALYHKGEHDKLQKLLTRAARLITGFSIIMALGLAVLAPYILPVFGEEFGAAYTPLLILLAAQLINAFTGPVMYLMSLTGHEKTTAALFGLTTLLNIGTNALLIPLYGMEGAAIATALGIAFLNITLFVLVRKRLGLNPSPYCPHP